MTTEEQIQRITDIAQEKGWSVNVEDKNETRVLFEFQRYTKYGQDFLFNADMQGEDIDSLIASVKEYYEGFAPDYEAYLWIGDDGHDSRNVKTLHINLQFFQRVNDSTARYGLGLKFFFTSSPMVER